MEDSKIVALFFDRNESALDELDKKYKRDCQSIVGNILSSDEDAEECESDTYLAAWQSIPPNKPNSLSAYLGKITRNLALDKLEKKQAAK